MCVGFIFQNRISGAEKSVSVVVNRPFTMFVTEHEQEIHDTSEPVILFKAKVSSIPSK